MNKDGLNALLLGGLLILTLPIFYLLFSKVILPTLWREETSMPEIGTTVEAPPAPAESD